MSSPRRLRIGCRYANGKSLELLRQFEWSNESSERRDAVILETRLHRSEHLREPPTKRGFKALELMDQGHEFDASWVPEHLCIPLRGSRLIRTGPLTRSLNAPLSGVGADQELCISTKI